MQKKIIATAVASVFAAPLAVHAASTVQLYGTVYAEYSSVSAGEGSTSTNKPVGADILQTPGSSIGFKGEEKLGGGMSAWFQCESTAEIGGVGQNGFCSRNSAVGLKGGFGNVYIGNWDTPFKRARVGLVGTNDTGIFGNSQLLWLKSTTTNNGVGSTSNTSSLTSQSDAGVFSRRQRQSINFDLPSMGGLNLGVSFSSANDSTNASASDAAAKPRILSLGGTYKSGNLILGAGWEKHSKVWNNKTFTSSMNPTAGATVTTTSATVAGDESGYHLSGAYNIGKHQVGFTYTGQTYHPVTAAGVVNTVKFKAWHLGGKISLSGANSLLVGYTVADSTSGTSGAKSARPTVAAPANGAKLYQIRFAHAFSKRTTGDVGYVRLANDVSGTYDLGGYSGTGTGAKSSAIAMSIKHSF